MSAYYNENDLACAAIIRQCIADGVIAPGDVDTRSIKDVQPSDLRGYTQCHFFAGGGLWSVAARIAGWSDDRHIWTASCPCQGESVAGKLLGAADPRDLWPDFFRLVGSCRPAVIVGEQVANAAGTHWLDRTISDLESENYAARAVDIPACAVDAPIERNRIYWISVAESGGGGRDWRAQEQERSAFYRTAAERPATLDVVSASGLGWGEGRPEPIIWRGRDAVTDTNAPGYVGGSLGIGRTETIGKPRDDEMPVGGRAAGGIECSYGAHGRNGSNWAGTEWIACHDGKARRTKPGLPFLVDGFPGRVDLWRVGGNAIVPVLAAEVIGALKDAIDAGEIAGDIRAR